MTPTARAVHAELARAGRASAAQVACSLGLSIEDTYAALVELDARDRARIATLVLRYRRQCGERARLWSAA